MTPSLRLVFAVHNHQPVGNFDGVFEQACEEAYLPFMDVVDDFPDLPVTMHISGSLLEWLEQHRTDYLDRIKASVAAGHMEILGGPYFESILASIPGRDRIGQIQLYVKHLEELFETRVRGMWVPERVWEPAFTSDLVDAGIEYTILDDSHFRWAGFSDDKLHGHYLTENEGRLLSVFPDDETLRYTIPWSEPDETIAYLRQLAEKFPGTVVSFGDDGEKFGSWPGTFNHVYGDKQWLRRFFQAIREQSEWLRVVTMAQAVDSVAPSGKVYLPNASYREMTEWALPTDQQIVYQQTRQHLEKLDDWKTVQPFFRAGMWRNFLVKYPESNDMYCRSLEISRRLAAMEDDPHHPLSESVRDSIRLELYRGQCNCPYWHGAFGGLYLPHLRNAIYRHLIAADTLLEKASGRSGRWVDISAEDFNLDARQEIRIASDRLIAYLSPARGGHLYELDVRSIETNLLSTLNRRPEPYHQMILDIGGKSESVDDIDFNKHEGARFKQDNLDQQIAYDRWPRKSLVDHFLRPGTTAEDFAAGNGEIGDFLLGVHESKTRKSSSRVEAILSREGRLGEHWIQMTKQISLDAARTGQLEFDYRLNQLPVGEEIQFAVEFNFSSMPASQPDRYFYDESGRRVGQLETVLNLSDQQRIGLVDEWLGVDTTLEASVPCNVWTFPIQTVSQSEGGYELVHQSSVVTLVWNFVVDESRSFHVQIQQCVDTSAAHARQLAAFSSES
ncbi:Alpha-amylase 1 [Thalassoglobus neptunius]|uniref:Alpha-amylase 1 n=1 Tax=Thalassoglobus neptunius TaxID=1938619 RepID=A0A5C5X6D9_9PLAN|nr:alpha-amylase/4-alpha-glucanotransferase domain-containing protein [Thalassoglobus neptunius]TWT58596.1 Alpha-amylase 1 [Thalassoglobus neptunius]